MQGTPTIDVGILGIPGLMIGLMFGYFLGGMTSLNFNYRIGLGIIVSFFGGLITALLFNSDPIRTYLPDTISISTFEVILIILSYFGGYALGAVANWGPLPEKPPERHIIYEPDDDDDCKVLSFLLT
ncbi:MAG: hypothetical protein ACXACG_12860 [Candidatus Thorarchaeota archaeon]|jgi:hypothetical protein